MRHYLRVHVTNLHALSTHPVFCPKSTIGPQGLFRHIWVTV